MTLGSVLTVALSSIPEKQGHDTIVIQFRQPPIGAPRFPFSGGLISRLWRSRFPRLAVPLPFWNGVNSVALGHEPHFISFVRQPDGRFRFFNVADGLEDSVMSMEDFAEGHLLHGTVIALTVYDNRNERTDAS